MLVENCIVRAYSGYFRELFRGNSSRKKLLNLFFFLLYSQSTEKIFDPERSPFKFCFNPIEFKKFLPVCFLEVFHQKLLIFCRKTVDSLAI